MSLWCVLITALAQLQSMSLCPVGSTAYSAAAGAQGTNRQACSAVLSQLAMLSPVALEHDTMYAVCSHLRFEQRLWS